jgi:hypothetical protein
MLTLNRRYRVVFDNLEGGVGIMNLHNPPISSTCTIQSVVEIELEKSGFPGVRWFSILENQLPVDKPRELWIADWDNKTLSVRS